ncbi:MAG TPA: cell division protein FtsL [Chloroflexota bacterium]|nr:cell division protein FtsL [Chloroflexota bacterium]
MQRETVWTPALPRTRRAAVKAPRVRRRALALPRIRVEPLALARQNPLVAATLLVSLALILYLVQANTATAMQIQLNQMRAARSQLSAVNAQLLVQADRLVAEHRIETLATTRLGMRPPSLNSALWLTVRVPEDRPRLPRPPRVTTQPLDWMERAWQLIHASL